MGKRDVMEGDADEIEHVDEGITSFGDISLNFQNYNLTRLTLSHNKLSSIPQNISDLVNLEVLTLWNNHIQELPTSISSLPRLRCLNVGMNRLSMLPRGFGSCPSLEVLDLTYNNLSERSLPGNFFFIRTLRALYLSDNDFEYFPVDVDRLLNLQILALRDNDLLELPAELGNLAKLRELHIQGNRLRMLPPSLGKLDLVGPRQVCRLENNPWIAPLAEQLRDEGVAAFWEYIRSSENYQFIYGRESAAQSAVPAKNPYHNKKICRMAIK